MPRSASPVDQCFPQCGEAITTRWTGAADGASFQVIVFLVAAPLPLSFAAKGNMASNPKMLDIFPRLASVRRMAAGLWPRFASIEGLGMRILLAIHVILLLLASTSFTIVTAFFGQASLQWCYFKFASNNGFGVEYVSDFSAPEIATYLLAFTFGVIGFSAAMKNKRPVVGALGAALSLLGILSFAIEGSHWFIDHNRSWLVYSPAATFLLAVLAFVPKRSSVSDDASLNRTINFGTKP